ncbi:winged helix-turn-helix domain-containing protein [Streptomyces radiopugnans]|nr:winged helix-turn-helix domain-containing protein [Streptomyces radiopugnans]
MGLRLLGPVDLVVDGRSVDLGGPRQRAVLAVLGLNANRVVPVEQLIDAVWDTAPPSTARGQIQTCISALRRILGDAGHPGAIATRQPGYMLVIGSEELDVLRFSALVAEARSHADEGGEERAAAVLREALALWRGGRARRRPQRDGAARGHRPGGPAAGRRRGTRAARPRVGQARGDLS